MKLYCSRCERKLKSTFNEENKNSPCCNYPVLTEESLRKLNTGLIPTVQTKIETSNEKPKERKARVKSVDPSSGIRKGTAKLACYLLWKSGKSVKQAGEALTAKGFTVGSSSVRSWYNRFNSRYGENEKGKSKKSGTSTSYRSIR